MKKLTRGVLIAACFLVLAAGGWMDQGYAAGSAKAASPAAARHAGQSAVAVTADQKIRLQDIAHKYQADAVPLLKQYAVEKAILDQLMNAQTVDETAIRAQFVKASSVGAELAVLRARRIHDLRAVLTPEQIKQFKQIEKEVAGFDTDRMLLRLANTTKGK